jgi:hypothetical protein
MAMPHVFAYGSLLGDATGTRCRLEGHRRVWGVAMDNRRTLPGYKYYLDRAGGRPDVRVAFVDVVPDPAARVDGVVFEVADLGALDARERNYRRVEVELDGLGAAWAYTGLAAARARYSSAVAGGRAVVAHAYLEGVRAGFAALGLGFGPDPPVPVVDLVRVDVPTNGAG